MSEIIFLGILALIVIGPKELPEVARTIGRFLNELKRSTSLLGEELKQQARFEPQSMQNHPPESHPQSPEQTEPEQMSLPSQPVPEDKK